MSLSPAFGSQVAAIMDVLAKAAVSEISKLVEDGTVVLRLEMCRKDNEIQELKRSLKLMEVELCQAREAVMSRTITDKLDQATVGTQVAVIDKPEGVQSHGGYVAPKTAESFQPQEHETTEDHDEMKPIVKSEPVEALDNQGMMEDAAVNVCFETGSELLWPPGAGACSMFEKSSTQQHVPMFPAEPFSSHRNTDCSYGAMPAATETSDDSLILRIKTEAEPLPVCLGGGASEPSIHLSRPPTGEDRCRPPAPQEPGPVSLVIPQVQRSTAMSDGHALARNNLRAKRFLSVWRANQRLLICPVCGKGFTRLSQLEEHRATHQPLKPFRCLECGKSFTQKTRLKTHQSVHTGERPFSCSICGKMFSRQDNCTRHERFHSGLKPYSCGQCGRSFTVLANLKIHQEIHLQGR